MCMYVYVVYVCVCMCKLMCMCVCIYIYVCVCMCVHYYLIKKYYANKGLNMCVYINVYMYVYVCEWVSEWVSEWVVSVCETYIMPRTSSHVDFHSLCRTFVFFFNFNSISFLPFTHSLCVSLFFLSFFSFSLAFVKYYNFLHLIH